MMRVNLAMIFPAVVYLAAIGMSIKLKSRDDYHLVTIFVMIGMGILFDFASASPLGNFAAAVELIGLAYYTLSLGLNLILTGMIVYRIWSHPRAVKDIPDCDKKYTSVTTIFVESAALYTIALIPL